jgi:predicted nucleic acid-binding protein
MNVLLDTNILTRILQPNHPHHKVALEALDLLKAGGSRLVIVSQNLFEFWVVCTRPSGENGLGLTTPEARLELSKAKTLFELLADAPQLYEEWERLVTTFDVKGKPAHDARLVAAMIVNGITHLLTFNTQDFGRYKSITVMNPEQFVREQRSGTIAP